MNQDTTKKAGNKKIIIAFFFAILLIAAVAARFIKIPAANNQNIKKYDISTENNFWIGVEKPQVEIIEFSDFACPYCKNSAETLKSLRNIYSGKIKIIYKDFIGHDDSYTLALAARCAGEQGAFWPMHDRLFSEQGSITIENADQQAKIIGINEDRFLRCYNGEYYKEQIAADNAESRELEITGTPAFFVNGYRISGDLPLENWKQIIDKFLIP